MLENDILGFKQYLLRNGRKLSTTEMQIFRLKRLLQEVDPFTFENFRDWWYGLIGRYNESYLNGILGTARIYARYLGQDIDPFVNETRQLKEKKSLKLTFSDDEISRILAVTRPPGTSYFGFDKWTMFLTVMAYTGMRPGEISKLTVKDIDFGREVFIVEDTKTNDNRFVPISPNLVLPLQNYMKRLPPSRYLFPRERWKTKDVPVAIVSAEEALEYRMKSCGIPKKRGLTLYSLRHSFITAMLEADVSLFKVQKIVGHKKVETTAIYSHLTTKDIVKAIKKLPLAQKNLDPHERMRMIVELIHTLELENDERFVYKLTESKNSIELLVAVK